MAELSKGEKLLVDCFASALYAHEQPKGAAVPMVMLLDYIRELEAKRGGTGENG